MMLGDTDITKWFQEESELVMTNGGNKLKGLSYNVALKNESFVVRYELSYKRLKCIAKIPKSGLNETSTSINIKR